VRLQLESILEELAQNSGHELRTGPSRGVFDLGFDIESIRVDPARTADQLKILQLAVRLPDQGTDRHPRHRDVARPDANRPTGAGRVAFDRGDVRNRRGRILRA